MSIFSDYKHGAMSDEEFDMACVQMNNEERYYEEHMYDEEEEDETDERGVGN